MGEERVQDTAEEVGLMFARIQHLQARARCRVSLAFGAALALLALAAAPPDSLGILAKPGLFRALTERPPDGAILLFDGTDTSRWVRRGSDRPITWKLEAGALTAGGGDIVTKEQFDNFYLHVEFMTPDMPGARGQGKGNSGVYLHGRYEIQVLDSYGIERPGRGDCGAVYGQSAPLVNACRPPLQWQSYDIFFRAPRFDAEGKLTEKPRVTVLQNGRVIQNNTEIQAATTASLASDIAPAGPILLQDHGNPVRYRNIWLVPLPSAGSERY